MSCDNCEKPQSGNEVHGIPIKVGEPLSSACERANTIGQIPQVVKLPWGTFVACNAVSGKISNAGIANPKNFFRDRSKECYGNPRGALAATTCA